MVKRPVNALLYPAFTDRATDNSSMHYTLPKKSRKIHRMEFFLKGTDWIRNDAVRQRRA